MNRIIKNGICYELADNKHVAKIIYSPDAKGNIMIPQSIQHLNHEYKIKVICNGAFKNNASIKSISFAPDSELSIIERYAFAYSSLEKISIPSSLGELEGGWNYCSSKKTQITMSQFNRNFIFQDENYILSKSFRKSRIFDVFNYCSNDITSIVIPSSIKKIESYAFSNCTNITLIEFAPNSELVIIGDYAFSHTSISNISIPPTVEEIHYAAFSFCDELKNVIFSETSKLRVIEKAVFYKSSIENISVPSGVGIIDEDTFFYCKNLRNVHFSSDSKLKSIKKRSFSGLNIISITIPSNVEEIEETFCMSSSKNCQFNIDPGNKNFKFLNNSLLLGKSSPDQIEFDVILYIVNYYDGISIPSYIKRIGNFPISCKKNIKWIEFESNSNLHSIGNDAFSGTLINTVVIPSSVEFIGNGSFAECKNFTSFEFSINSKLKKIGSFAFFNCNIDTIKIPSSVEIIEKSAFFLCMYLNTVIFEEDSKLELIDDGAFQMTGINNIKIPLKVKRIGNNAFESCTNLQSIEISEDSNLCSIGNKAFYLTSLKAFSFPSKVRKIKDQAFACCKKLESVTFSVGSSLTEVGSYAFAFCDELKFIEFLSEKTLTIGDNCFMNSKQLKLISIPNVNNLSIHLSSINYSLNDFTLSVNANAKIHFGEI